MSRVPRTLVSYFEIATGEIKGSALATSNELAVLDVAFGYLDGYHEANTHYVSDGVAVPKQPFPIAVSLNTISGIPADTQAVVMKVGIPRQVISDGVLELTPLGGMEEDVVVILTHPHYLTQQVVVPCG